MHVKGKMMAFCGLFIALSVVCMSLGSVIETNTLFLLAAASFFVGIVIREFGMRTGGAFYVADVLLGLLITYPLQIFQSHQQGLHAGTSGPVGKKKGNPPCRKRGFYPSGMAGRVKGETSAG